MIRYYRDKKVVGVFVRFRAPLQLSGGSGETRLGAQRPSALASGRNQLVHFMLMAGSTDNGLTFCAKPRNSSAQVSVVCPGAQIAFKDARRRSWLLRSRLK
jgi:hypothetical protein